MLSRERWACLSWANHSVGAQSCPIPLGCSAGLSDWTCLWHVQVLHSKVCKRWVTWSAIVEEHKENSFQEPSGPLDFSAEDFLVTYRYVASNGSVRLNIYFFD